MFWRLLRRNDLGKFREEDCWAVVEFDASASSANAAVSNAIASELLYKGFNVLLVGRHLEHVQKSLASSHSDRRIAVMSNEHLGHEDDFSIQTESLKSLTKMTTLVVLSSADPTLLSRMLNADNPVGPKSCLRMLQMILPGLRKDRPVAVVVAGGPLSFYSDEHVKRMDYYETFITSLSQEMRDLKLENVEFLYTDCHSASLVSEGRNETWMNPSPESYAKSVLQSVGCGYAHVISYWPHELLAWMLWILLLVFPRSTLRNLEHRVGL